MNENEFALGIEVVILFVRNEQKDCNVKPDPQGNAQKPIKMVEKRLGGSKTDDLREKTTHCWDTLRIFNLIISSNGFHHACQLNEFLYSKGDKSVLFLKSLLNDCGCSKPS